MLTATTLRGPDQISVSQCVNQTGMSEADCQRLLMEIQYQPDLYYTALKAGLLGLSAYACTKYIQSQTGAPKKISGPACSWAVNKIWDAWSWIMSYGGPTWKTLSADGYKGIHWRPCASWQELQPGEHWNANLKHCVLNVAILEKKDQPKVVVYTPCEYLPNNVFHKVCRDKDGVFRTVGQKKPTISSGWFGKRLTDWWPTQFEQTPWQSPIPTSSASPLGPRYKFDVSQQNLAPVPKTNYPTGTIATKVDSKWRVAIPKTSLSGENDYTIVETTTNPLTRGARIVRPWLFEYMTGKRSWYETPPAWVAFGVLGASIIGGVVIYKKRKG